MSIDKTTKTNQDAIICAPKLLPNENYHFFAICDGHGK